MNFRNENPKCNSKRELSTAAILRIEHGAFLLGAAVWPWN